MLRAVLLSFAFSHMLPAQPAAAPCDLMRSSSLEDEARQEFAHKSYAAAAHGFQDAFDACQTMHALLLEASKAAGAARDYPLAIRAARQFLGLEPNSVEGKIAVANAYFMAQQFPDALQWAEQVLKSSPSDPSALKLKGNIEYLMGRTAAALNTFVVLLDSHPQDADAAYMLGRIYYQEGRIDYAIGQFNRVLKI